MTESTSPEAVRPPVSSADHENGSGVESTSEPHSISGSGSGNEKEVESGKETENESGDNFLDKTSGNNGKNIGKKRRARIGLFLARSCLSTLYKRLRFRRQITSVSTQDVTTIGEETSASNGVYEKSTDPPKATVVPRAITTLSLPEHFNSDPSTQSLGQPRSSNRPYSQSYTQMATYQSLQYPRHSFYSGSSPRSSGYSSLHPSAQDLSSPDTARAAALNRPSARRFTITGLPPPGVPIPSGPLYGPYQNPPLRPAPFLPPFIPPQPSSLLRPAAPSRIPDFPSTLPINAKRPSTAPSSSTYYSRMYGTKPTGSTGTMMSNESHVGNGVFASSYIRQPGVPLSTVLATPSPAATGDSAETPSLFIRGNEIGWRTTPDGLLDPTLQARLGESNPDASRSTVGLRDDQDYSRPIRPQLNNAGESSTTVNSYESRGADPGLGVEKQDS